MSRNNDVCKVLFLPESAAEAVDTLPSALANGEWGVFDYDTGKAINPDIATNGLPNNFYIMYVGDGTLGTAGEIYTSTGTHIQQRNVRYYTQNDDATAVGQAITLDNIVVESGADATNYDYGVKLDFRGNTEVYQRFGMNQATKFAVANTRCVGSSGASEVAAMEVAIQIFEAFMYDSDQFMSLSLDWTGTYATAPKPILYVAGATSTQAAVQTDLNELRAAGDSAAADTPVLVITMTDFSAMYYFCNVNPKYFKLRQIAAIPSLSGANCKWADFEQTVAMVYEEGTGYDIQELEYLAGGFTGKPGPYRQSRLHGLPFSDYEYIAIKTTKYTVNVLSYDQFSVAGWQEHLNNQSSYFILVATPAATAGFPSPVLDAIATACGVTKLTT